MDQFFIVLGIIIFAISGGHIFRVWLDGKVKKRKATKWLHERVGIAEGKFQKAYSSLKPDEIAALLGGGFSMFFKNFPYRIENKGEAMKRYEEVMKGDQRLSVFNQKIIILSEESALITYNWMRGSITGKTTHVWARDPSTGWKLKHDHTSFNVGD